MGFGFTFLNAAMLAAAGAVVIPIVIHFLSRQKPKPLRFAAVEFILLSKLKVMRRVRVKQILLLALRCSVLGFAGLALAMPALVEKRAIVAAGPEPESVAIVLDASYSMGYRAGDETLFDAARGRAQEIVQGLAEGSNAAVIAAAGKAEAPHSGLSADSSFLSEAAASAKLTAERGDLGTALRTALSLLAQSDRPGRRVVLISDLTAGSLDLDKVPAGRTGDGKPVALDLVESRDLAGIAPPLANVEVAEVAVAASADPGQSSMRVEFTAVSFSEQPAENLDAVLLVDGEAKARTFLNVPAGGKAEGAFTHSLEGTGVHGCRVALRPDSLPLDDERHFLAYSSGTLKVLVVNGDPRGGSFRDETFYLERAFTPAAGVRSQLGCAIRGADDLGKERLSGYDAIWLANVRSIPRERAGELVNAVRGGAALVISGGDNLDLDWYNKALAELLPSEIWQVKSVEKKEGNGGGGFDLGDIDAKSPIFTVFDEASLASLRKVKTSGYLLMRPELRQGAKVHARFADGAPLLASAPFGDGTVLVLATTVDRDWSGLPVSTAFLPLVQQALKFSTKSLFPRGERAFLVGEMAPFDGAPGSKAIRVTAPDGMKTEIEVSPGGKPSFSGTADPGCYSTEQLVNGKWQDDPAQGFCVNVDPAEGDLRPVQKADLYEKWGGKSQEGQASTGSSGWTGKGLWGALLVAALMLLLAEAYVGMRA